MSTTDTLIVLAVVGARLLVPLLIPRFPVPAIITCLVLDAADQTIFQNWTSLDLDGYQLYDKALDIYYLTIAYLSTIRNWGGGPDFEVGRFLWYYRLVGVLIFEYTQARWVLMLFPNTFEYFFIAVEAYKINRNPNRIAMKWVVGLAAFIWIFIKLPQEWWIHVAQLDFTDFVEEHFTTIGFVLAAIALAGLLVLAWVQLRKRLPAPEWAPTLDADRQGLELGWRRPHREARPNAFFGWSFVEKVVLVSLVSSIFGGMLPGVNANLVETFTVVAFVIVVNTVLSQLLARRGVTWANTGVQFVAMLAANVITVGGYGLLFDQRSTASFGEIVFLTGLLTLIVVLYDRFQGIEHERAQLGAATRAGLGPAT